MMVSSRGSTVYLPVLLLQLLVRCPIPCPELLLFLVHAGKVLQVMHHCQCFREWYLFQDLHRMVSSAQFHQQQTAGNSQVYGSSRSSDKPTMGSEGMTFSYRASSLPVGYYALQGECFP
uniref:Secreted protein n=1 Tax=Nicotiana tabacum TaxID=4097 RepID=A0A1S4BJL2_TOBAC|nr:PREDICTED: uncharacterized protein LOC107809009 [Nicotiana tabacum]